MTSRSYDLRKRTVNSQPATSNTCRGQTHQPQLIAQTDPKAHAHPITQSELGDVDQPDVDETQNFYTFAEEPANIGGTPPITPFEHTAFVAFNRSGPVQRSPMVELNNPHDSSEMVFAADGARRVNSPF